MVLIRSFPLQKLPHAPAKPQKPSAQLDFFHNSSNAVKKSSASEPERKKRKTEQKQQQKRAKEEKEKESEEEEDSESEQEEEESDADEKPQKESAGSGMPCLTFISKRLVFYSSRVFAQCILFSFDGSHQYGIACVLAPINVLNFIFNLCRVRDTFLLCA